MENTEIPHAHELALSLQPPLRLDVLLRMLGDQYWEQDTTFRFTFLSGSLERTSGLHPKRLIGKTRWELPTLNLDEAAWQRHREDLLAQRPFRKLLLSRPGYDGMPRWYLDSGEPWFNEAGHFLGYRGISRDITDIKNTQHALAQSEARLLDIFESTVEYIWETDSEGHIVYLSPRAEAILGFPCAAMLGHNFADLMPACDAQRIKAMLHAHHQTGKKLFTLEHTILRGGLDANITATTRAAGVDNIIWLQLNGKSILNKQGEIIGYRGTAHDISERKQANRRIHDLVTRDPLTALPNRTQLNVHLTEAISRAQHSNTRIAALCINIDHFKLVNDSLGHLVGDELIRVVGERINACVDDHDSAAHIVARAGGDEFVVLIEAIADTDAAIDADKNARDAAKNAMAVLSCKLLREIALPITSSQSALSVTASIGIALYPNHGADAYSLLQSADTAVHFAKEQGRNRFEFFAVQLGERVNEKLKIENALRKALEQNQFSLVYQPIVGEGHRFSTDAAFHEVDESGPNLRSAEALLRWHHPDFGAVSPSRFIPVAEEIGLILEIGEWVLHEVIADLCRWRAQGLPLIPIAVNVSTIQLQLGEPFISMILAALAAARLPAASIILEMTESAVMADVESTIITLRKLEAAGIRVAIDDFGTGYSSLEQLRRLPVSTLKIDQSFVAALHLDAPSHAIVRAMMGMVKALGLSVIAEGVETPAQWQMLKELGCRHFQGFHFAQPLTPEDMVSWLLTSPGQTAPLILNNALDNVFNNVLNNPSDNAGAQFARFS